MKISQEVQDFLNLMLQYDVTLYRSTITGRIGFIYEICDLDACLAEGSVVKICLKKEVK